MSFAQAQKKPLDFEDVVRSKGFELDELLEEKKDDPGALIEEMF